MKVNSTTWLSVIALLITLTACEDHRIPASPQFRIKKVTTQSTEQSSQEFSTHTYTYDNQGRLATILTGYYRRSRGNNSDVYYTSVFHYGANGSLMSLEYQPDYTAQGTIKPSRYDYEYDNTGNAIRIKYAQMTSDTASDRLSRTTFNLEYNEAKLPVKITETNEELKSGSVTEYTYEQGNVVKIKIDTFTSPDKVVESTTYTYKFDDKPNPFYGLYIGAPYPLIFSDYKFKYNSFYQSNTFNKNNFLLDGLKYEYDSAGYLVKIEKNSPTGFEPTTTFEYEMY